MKIRRVFANFIVLLVAAGAAFYVGWVQFLVRPGQFGIMVSKTGGLYPEPVTAGSFLWRWERLLPTNVTLHVFEDRPRSYRQTVQGVLPSADIYAQQLAPDAGPPDFSYRLELDVTLSVTPDEVWSLVRSATVQTEADLNEWLERKAKIAAERTAGYFLTRADGHLPQVPGTLDAGSLSGLVRGGDFDGLTLLSVDVSAAHIPDMELYGQARESFARFQAEVDGALKARAEATAAAIADEDRAMERLERFAQMLEKYPQLNELSQNGNLNQTIELLQQLHY